MASILLKNIPKEIHAEVKRRARRNRRSINGEIISCLESVLRVYPCEPAVELGEVRQLRSQVKGFLTGRLLEELKSEGRP
jgi:plasmid stability protein